MSPSDLEDGWENVSAESPAGPGCYYRRLSGAGGWPAHVAVTLPGSVRALILEADKRELRRHRFAEEARGFKIDVIPDEFGRNDRASLRIAENTGSGREIFPVFCADIATHWLSSADIGAALEDLEKRLQKWKRFFQRGRGEGLSREDYIGLFGELCFFRRCMDAGVDVGRLVGAWNGPVSANQDFTFGPVAVEVKTATGNNPQIVHISNVRQLDGTGLSRLFLCHQVFDFREASGMTLVDLVLHLRRELEDISPMVAAAFGDKLLEAGFVDTQVGEFAQWGFTERPLGAVFDVQDGFPRLLENAVPHGIASLTYDLDLSAASAFVCRAEDVWEEIAQDHG
jgi:hypothetical protein